MTLVSASLARELERFGPVRENEPLSRRTSWRIGGPADVHLIVKDEASLAAAVQAAWNAGTPVFILGSGSNVLIGDGGIRGLVIENNTMQTQKLAEDPECGLLLRVASGMPLAKIGIQMCKAGWQGLEWAVGIPGTVGGAVVSNAGAHGGVTAAIVESVRVLTRTHGIIDLPAAELGFGYRTSKFLTVWRHEGTPPVILSVDFRLAAAPLDELKARSAEHTAYRKATQPNQPSCGSVFTNPPGESAGRLIDQLGLKGRAIGKVQISPKHANFIVNLGNARAADAEALVLLARDEVKRAYGITLRPEVERVGEGLSGEWGE